MNKSTTKHATWIPHYECSRCGEIVKKKKQQECPFCHADMRLERSVKSICKHRDHDTCAEFCSGFDVCCEEYMPTDVWWEGRKEVSEHEQVDL